MLCLAFILCVSFSFSLLSCAQCPLLLVLVRMLARPLHSVRLQYSFGRDDTDSSSSAPFFTRAPLAYKLVVGPSLPVPCAVPGPQLPSWPARPRPTTRVGQNPDRQDRTRLELDRRWEALCAPGRSRNLCLVYAVGVSFASAESARPES